MSFVWAKVTSVVPLRVRLAGDSVELPFTPKALVDVDALVVGDFVRVEESEGQRIIVGRSGGVPIPPFVTTRTVSYTTSSLADGASETAEIALGVGFTLLHFQASHAGRARVYQSVAHRSADASRPVGVFPFGDHGLIFEDDGAAAGSYATVAVGGLLSGESLTPCSFTNMSGATRAITFIFTVRG